MAWYRESFTFFFYMLTLLFGWLLLIRSQERRLLSSNCREDNEEGLIEKFQDGKVVAYFVVLFGHFS
jgi:hypothetical protein